MNFIAPTTNTTATTADAADSLDDLLCNAMMQTGAIAGAIMDTDSATCLQSLHQGEPQIDFTANVGRFITLIKGHSSLVWSLGIVDAPQDILITLDSQWHIIRLLGNRANGNEGLFLYLVMDRDIDIPTNTQPTAIIAPDFVLSAEDKDRLHRLRKEAIRRRTSGLYYDYDEESDSPIVQSVPRGFAESAKMLPPDTDEDDLPAFMREDAVLCLLGLDNQE